MVLNSGFPRKFERVFQMKASPSVTQGFQRWLMQLIGIAELRVRVTFWLGQALGVDGECGRLEVNVVQTCRDRRSSIHNFAVI
jgi:hypothetical protein